MSSNYINVLSNKLKEKNLSDNSVKLYLRNLRLLNNDKSFKNLKFLNKPEEIMTKLKNKKLSDNTIRNYIITIVSALQTNGEASKKVYNKYLEILKKMNSDYSKKQKENKKTDTQEQNWITWDDIIKKHDELKKIVETYNKKELTEDEYNILLSYMVLSLYFYIPPRRNADYSLMFIVKKGEPENKNYNYLVLNEKKFIFNRYKTMKTNGQQIIEFDNKLNEVINKYLKYHPLIQNSKKYDNVRFLVTYNGSALDKVNSITRILNKVFNKKKVGSSMLRHIYLTSKYGDVLKEQKKDAQEMGHTVGMAQDYIKE